MCCSDCLPFHQKPFCLYKMLEALSSIYTTLVVSLIEYGENVDYIMFV